MTAMNNMLKNAKEWCIKAWRYLSEMPRNIGHFFSRLWENRHELKQNQRLVIMDNETYKEKWSLQLSAINIFVWGGISIIVLIVLTALLIAFSPLRGFIPGYTNTQLVEQTYQNAIIIDSLENQLRGQEQMLADIKDVIMGNDPGTRIKAADSLRAANDTVSKKQNKTNEYSHSAADSLLRKEIEEADHYSVHSKKSSKTSRGAADDMNSNTQANTTSLLLFTPMKGNVISQFNNQKKHYGVDIAGAINTAVKAVAPGTVIFANFTTETGYVIAIQHQGGMISVYKHNGSLLKHDGDVVRAGEPIAYLGNTGELSSGPHLHFELWIGGKPVNPLVYISF